MDHSPLQGSAATQASATGQGSVSAQQFINYLGESGLLSLVEIKSLVAAMSPQQRQDARQLAEELVRLNKLTRYQASVLYQGKVRGLVLGNYVILEKLGQGGMGMVFKAQHRRINRVVALKVLPPAVTKNPGAVKRFQREAQAAARLSHPNIVTAYDADQAQEVHFLVMEYVEGSDLSRLVKEEGPLAVQQAVSCILDAARGLEHAHAAGIVHRDIKPSNLLLTKAHGSQAVGLGVVKILDMGLARIDAGQAGNAPPQGGSSQEELTGTGNILGTFEYMAPEQALNTRHADHRADIYSLGCTLHHLLTGRVMYTGETAMEKLLAHREAPIPSLRAVRPDVPEDLDAIYQRMVAKTPEARYQSMHKIIVDLEASLAGGMPAKRPSTLRPGGQSATAQSETPPELQADRTPTGLAQPPRPAGKQWRVAAGVFLLLTIASALVAGSLWSGPSTPPPSKLAIPSPVTRHNTRPEPPANASPPLAMAPFSAAEAKLHQERWTAYLKLEVQGTNSVGMKLVLIPPGEFVMGSEDNLGIPDRRPAHNVRITRPFYLGIHEVTQEQYTRVMGKNPSQFTRENGSGNYPVESVTWDEAQKYCEDLSATPAERNAKRHYRLPTEAEWEYACRAGTTTRFSFGDALTSAQANFEESRPKQLRPVGSYPPNPFGLFDMHGNVAEWVKDWYDPRYYQERTPVDPTGPPTGNQHPVRGGSFPHGSVNCMSSNRMGLKTTYVGPDIGFRVLCEVPPEIYLGLGAPPK